MHMPRNANQPDIHMHLPLQAHDHPDSIILNDFICIHKYAVRDGRRIVPVLQARKGAMFNASLVQADILDPQYAEEQTQMHAVQHIFLHKQPEVTNRWQLFAEIAWMKISDYSPLNSDESYWEELCV